jgi:capsular polysaccharide biosynthesis protein/Mrp family chromosome partitioning ATPase
MAGWSTEGRLVERDDLLSVVRRWWATVLVATVLAATIGLLFSSAVPISHESRVRLLVGPVVGTNDELRAAGQVTRTVGELVSSAPVMEATIAELGIDRSPRQLREAVRPTADSATRLLIIRVRDADAGLAAAIADEVARQLIVLIEADGTNGMVAPLQVVDGASRGEPVGVPMTMIIALSALAGLVASSVLVLVVENLDESVRDAPDLVEVSGVDYLGRVTSARPGAASGGLVVENAPDSSRAADHRMLATKVELIANRERARSLLVLGVGNARGAGEVTANIGKVLSERRRCVTLLDANTHDPQMTTLLGLQRHPGLTELLGTAERADDGEVHAGAYTFSLDPRLFVVPSGMVPDGPSGTVPGRPNADTGTPPWVVRLLLRQADFVVVNAAPVHTSATSLVWAGAVDAVLLVVPRHRTSRGELSHLMENLRLVGTDVIGAVFEDRRRLVRVPSPRRESRSSALAASTMLRARDQRPPGERRSTHAGRPTSGDRT